MPDSKIDHPLALSRLLTAARFGRKAHIVGITAAASAGKSTLINKLIGVLREDNFRVVVLAVDPTDCVSGGAILGDRIRMQDHYLDEGVFIRSIASAGTVQASAPQLKEMIGVASYFADFVIVESSGAGQADLGIKAFVDTFVFLPDTKGDAINFLKAGIHDHAHILAVNARQDTDARDQRFLREAGSFTKTFIDGWQRLVFKVNAETGEEVAALVREGICKHRDFLMLQA